MGSAVMVKLIVKIAGLTSMDASVADIKRRFPEDLAPATSVLCKEALVNLRTQGFCSARTPRGKKSSSLSAAATALQQHRSLQHELLQLEQQQLQQL